MGNAPVDAVTVEVVRAALNAAAERIENITKRLNETVPENGVPMG